VSQRPPDPTDTELQVLRVLWRRGPSTVREVHDALYEGTSVGYTTALKLLQNLHAKGLVRRDESRRQHIYEAVAPESETMSGVVKALIDRAFDGRAAALALRALGAGRASREELTALKEMIRKLEGGAR
jgi:BlaI family transcriptional regulator, penicillinase repressor